jgi:hypothetical protein
VLAIARGSQSETLLGGSRNWNGGITNANLESGFAHWQPDPRPEGANDKMINYDLLRAIERERVEELCSRFFPNGEKVGHEWKLGDVSGAPGNSLGVELTGEKAGVWHDRTTGEGGGFVKLLAANHNTTFVQATQEIERALGISLSADSGMSNCYRATNSTEVSRSKRTNALALDNLVPCNDTDMAELCGLRSIPIEGLRIGIERRVLFAYDHPAEGRLWVIADDARRNAICRRLDGLVFSNGAKSKCWRESQANWPIGIAQATNFPAIALCEGAPDFLAAFYLAWVGAAESLVMPVCMTGASCRIHEDALPLFRGKRVRIFGHTDTAGQKAVGIWAEQLRSVQAEVDQFDFAGLFKADGSPAKDLNDFIVADHKRSGFGIELTTGAFDFGLERGAA